MPQHAAATMLLGVLSMGRIWPVVDGAVICYEANMRQVSAEAP
jgi:hypothetical protein